MIELVSIHIPKTAGSSFLKILLDNYGDDIFHYRGEEPNLSEFKAIHGHFDAKKYLGLYPDSKWIAWVRHPVIRLISFYNYMVYNDKSYSGSFESFIEIEQFINQQTAFLAGKDLNSYFFIGVQEFWGEDIAELSGKMNWSSSLLIQDNVNKNPNYHEELSLLIRDERLVKKIISLNEEDMELYYKLLSIRAKRRKENLYYQYWFLGQNQLVHSSKNFEESAINSSRSGDNSVKINNIFIKNSKLEETHVFHVGDLAIVSISLELIAREEDIIVGFLIRNEYGKEIFGTNTELLRGPSSFSLEDGFVEVKFSTNLYIDTGTYYLTVGAHGSGGTQYDWLNNCQKFKIINYDPRYVKNDFAGMALLPTKVLVQSKSSMFYGSNNFSFNSLSSSIECLAEPLIKIVSTEKLNIPVYITNTGSDLWDSSANQNPVFLSYHLLDINYKIIKYDNKRTAFPEPVLPRERLRVNLEIELPEPGKYIIEIDLVKEGISWFKEKDAKSIFVFLEIAPNDQKDCRSLQRQGQPASP
ncbi:MAG TPA: Wzt carbohydrate-binding domain-containing protein [Candidatus Competibacter sp.]|nr:Wzt carbohydrate-binding domain-containing protein [Candidatus Competibacter sp.]